MKSIVSTLKRSRSSLKALKVPDIKLRPLTEFCDQGKFANIEKVHVLLLNGLDQLLQLEEKKWTQEILFNTVAVTAMGVSQIAVGTVIELYSVGVMTHVGAAFVSEGVNDLFFAAGALKSGYFSWEVYKQHKLESLMVSAATAGIGAYLSRGAKVSRFGHKLAGPNFEFGKNVAEMCGTQLIETAGTKVIKGEVVKSLASGCKVIGKEVAKRITLKTIEGIAFGLANAGVDTLVENYLQALCEGIASHILSDIECEVEKHNISISLEKAYKLLGREKAGKSIDDLTKSVFTRQSYVEEFLPIANKIASSVTQGIGEAVKKRSKTSNKLVLPIDTISKIVNWLERSTQIANIIRITNNLLDNLDQEIKDRLNKLEKDVDCNQKQEVENDYESFKKEVIDQWKLLLREKAGQIIARHIVSPVLKEGANRLVRYVGKKVQEAYQSYKESGYSERLRELKEEYKEKLQGEQQCDNTSKTEKHITEKYHKDLQKLMIKTRNPNLLADIVRENIPMDMTCVSACIQVVPKILEKEGIVIPGLTITVEGDCGIRQTFSSASNETEGITIRLELKDNHFRLCGSSTSGNSSESKNYCLYEALSDAIPGLKNIISPEGFRDKVADCIKHDEGIRYQIQEGWHRLPMSLGAFGGATKRRRSKSVQDFESSSIDNENLNNKRPQRRNRKVPDHLKDRLTRFFRIGGMIQRASEQTNIPRDQVVKSGASQFQDQSSNKGRDIHAAHVVRLGEVNPEMSEQLYNEFRNFLGHTQDVPKYANVWDGVGGDIDRFQSEKLKELARINFGGSLTTEEASIIQSAKEDFIAVLDKQIDGGKLGDREKSELRKLKEDLTNVTTEKLFEKGKKGYSGKGMESYQ